MGLFGSIPKPPKGTTHQSGPDGLDSWSLQRLQAELDRINRARAYQEGPGNDIAIAGAQIIDYYSPKQSGNSVQATQAQNQTLYTGFGPQNAGAGVIAFHGTTAYGPSTGGVTQVQELRQQYEERQNQANSDTGGLFGGNTQNAIGSIGANSAANASNNRPVASGSPSASPIGSIAGNQPTPEQRPSEADIWATYDAAVQAGSADLAELEGAGTNSGLGATGVGDDFFTQRLEQAIQTKRTEFAAFNQQSNTPTNVPASELEARDENQSRGRRRGARGGGAPSRPSPLSTTSSGATGGVV